MLLSYDIAVIRWITSCQKNRMITHNNTSACTRMSMSAAPFLIEIMFMLKAIESHFQRVI